MSSRFELRLLVEGVNDKHVVIHLLLHHAVNAVDVQECGGYAELEKRVQAELVGSNTKRIGVVADADEYPDRRWESLRHLLDTKGYADLPTDLPEEGLQANGGNKPLGVWLMPNNKSIGCLEHFVEALIPDGDNQWVRAQDAVCQIPRGERRFKPQFEPKAKVHTWLAWQEEPGTPMGAAITKRYLDPSQPTAQAFVDWVKRLLAVEAPD